jgi:DNA-binding CsgD family transcriptional regulator
MTKIGQFNEWMSFHPGMEDIPRALATDYLTEYGVKGIRFGLINSDNSIFLLGQYGYPDAMAWRNRTILSAEWHAIDAPDIQLIVSISGKKWTDDRCFYLNTLRDHGVVNGYLVVEFIHPIINDNKQVIGDAIDELCMPIALYLSFQISRSADQVVSTNELDNTRASGGSQLSVRQLTILRGMVEGKTNHELAIELGYSVSTVRHETMRIYQALSVSDRKEAAKKALVLGIV